MLLCRICEQLIPSSEMAKHSEECMKWELMLEWDGREMMVFNSDQQLARFRNRVKEIIAVLDESLQEVKRKPSEPSLEECDRGLSRWRDLMG